MCNNSSALLPLASGLVVVLSTLASEVQSPSRLNLLAVCIRSHWGGVLQRTLLLAAAVDVRIPEFRNSMEFRNSAEFVLYPGTAADFLFTAVAKKYGSLLAE